MIKSTLAALGAALVSAALVGAPAAHAGDPAAERAFLDEFHQAVPLVPIITWNDRLSLDLGYTICRAKRDGIDLEHYRASGWQGEAIGPALRHLCPNPQPGDKIGLDAPGPPPPPPPPPPPLPAEQA
ncbi:hypothetical protein BHQ15_12250 [Mycolicibacillus koreensis]|nr:hypothetical protein BHQ15_12250 [Mycolicibacillus koreensis]